MEMSDRCLIDADLTVFAIWVLTQWNDIILANSTTASHKVSPVVIDEGNLECRDILCLSLQNTREWFSWDDGNWPVVRRRDYNLALLGKWYCWSHFVQYLYILKSHTRRSEKDSTLGRPRSENGNISWVWPFHTVIPLMVNCIIPPRFQAVIWFPQFHLSGPSLSWKISKFYRRCKNWPSMATLNRNLLHVAMHHLIKFEADTLNP